MSWRTGLDSFLKSSGMDASDLSNSKSDAVDTQAGVDYDSIASAGEKYLNGPARLPTEQLSSSAATDINLTADEREQIRLREHELRDKREFEKVEAEKEQQADQARREHTMRDDADRRELARMNKEHSLVDRRLEHMEAEIVTTETSLDHRMDKMMVHSMQEMEEQVAAYQAGEAGEEAERLRAIEVQKALVMHSQTTNRLGLLRVGAGGNGNAASASTSAAVGGSASEFSSVMSTLSTSGSTTAPPGYGARALAEAAAGSAARKYEFEGGSSGSSGSSGDVTVRKAGSVESHLGLTLAELDAAMPVGAPPVYEATQMFEQGEMLTDESFVPLHVYGKPSARCNSCYDEIKVDITAGYSGRANLDPRNKANMFHTECFFAKGADICQYCTFPLVANTERQLTGIWGNYKLKKYHVECFQNYVGPRCEHCFDVVFENTEKGYSGRWINRPSDGALLHQECYLFLLAKHIHGSNGTADSTSNSLGYKSKMAPNEMLLPGYKETSNDKGTTN